MGNTALGSVLNRPEKWRTHPYSRMGDTCERMDLGDFL